MIATHPHLSVFAGEVNQIKVDFIHGIKNDPVIKGLRKSFDVYLAGDNERMLEGSVTGCHKELKTCLDGFPKEYFASKFCLLTKTENPFGGFDLVFISQEYRDVIFTAWMFPDRSSAPQTWLLRSIVENPATGNKELLARIQVAAKECIVDPSMGF